ncbi:MAG: hypothetical protein JO205_12550 [Pseudolabrys sp.]|nr:hypothetical protein [Pseudolabrys sp.]
MQLITEHSGPSVLSRIFASRQQCPQCGDRLIAPEVTEFIEGGTIQHYWVCDRCGEESQTFVTPPSI